MGVNFLIAHVFDRGGNVWFILFAGVAMEATPAQAQRWDYSGGAGAILPFSAYNLLRNCNYLLPPDLSRLDQQLRPNDPGNDININNSHLLNKTLINPSIFGYSHVCLNDQINNKNEISTLYPPGNYKRQRGEKKPIPEEQKDERYYERRRRNNQAAKKSRDARKIREDQIALRATILEHENAILRAQVLTLREEASSLRQMLLQKKALELAARDSPICIT